MHANLKDLIDALPQEAEGATRNEGRHLARRAAEDIRGPCAASFAGWFVSPVVDRRRALDADHARGSCSLGAAVVFGLDREEAAARCSR